MKKEIVDGSKVFSDIYTDRKSHTWSILQRDDGSVSLYVNLIGTHQVIYDSLDNEPPSEFALSVIQQLAELAEGINALLEQVGKGEGKT